MIGLFLIAIMLFSTFAYAVLQAFYPRNSAKLPDSNIVNYPLDSNLKAALIQNGRTIITFEYNENCSFCADQKAQLESFTNTYKPQIFLEELTTSRIDSSNIIIASAYGDQTIDDGNATRIVSSLCQLMVYPPATCALQRT